MTLSVTSPPPVYSENRKPDLLSKTLPLCTHCQFPLKKKAAPEQGPHFCCYGCAFAYQVVNAGPEGEKVSWITVKLGIAAFLAMNVMGFALALHSSSIYPDFYQHLGRGGQAYDQLLRYLLLFLSAPVFFLIGVPLYENIILEARARRWGVDGFIGVSVLAAFGYSLVNTVRGEGPVYFDIAVMVLLFLTLGRYLEARFRFKAAKSLEHLLDEKKETAQLSSSSGEQTVIADFLKPGDLIILRAGSRVPVDGVIEQGSAVLEMAAMTGEFLPSVVTAGDALWSGAVLTEGFLKMRVTHRLGNSWTARLKSTVQDAKKSKAPVEYFADKAVFAVSCVTAVSAVFAFYLGAREHGAMAGLLRMLAVLVIVCPCALGAAIPLAMWKTFESVVNRGILFKDLSRLEMLSKIKAVFFDKTGTLTETLPELISTVNRSLKTEDELIRAAASLAQVSAHPFSKALVRAARERGLLLEMPLEIETFTGKGLSGTLPGFGKAVLGSGALIHEFYAGEGFSLPEEPGEAQVLFAVEGKIGGIFIFDEVLRREGVEACAKLKKAGVKLFILTGDPGASREKWKEAFGAEVFSGLKPSEKYDRIRDWEKEHGPALAVGEGLNDAPMLAGASVSCALAGAVDRTRDSADFTLPDNDLSRVVWLHALAKRTMQKIKENLFWAFFYNLLAVPLAAAGKINPVAAALLMIFSSLFIIVRSMNTQDKVKMENSYEPA